MDAKIEKEVKRLNDKYGNKAAFSGSQMLDQKVKVVPTGILALDYALGTGGWPLGAPVYIWGAPDIGKSSSIGLTAIAQAQKAGRYPGIIATEPGFDAKWAEKNGVDLDKVVIANPDHGEEAFEILHDWVNTKVIDFILFDSIGGIGSESESEGGKARVGGNSKLITEGVRRIVMRSWKNNVGIIFLNQIRDDLNSIYAGQVTVPGGHAIKHFCPIWIHVKPHSDKYTIKVNTGDKPTDLLVGRKLVAHITRNKLSEGTGYKALFNYFQKETEQFGFGIDKEFDIISTGIVSGALRLEGMSYYHKSFPGGKLVGKPKVFEFLNTNPKAYEQVRKDVLDVMVSKAGVPKTVNPEDLNDDE